MSTWIHFGWSTFHIWSRCLNPFFFPSTWLPASMEHMLGRKFPGDSVQKLKAKVDRCSWQLWLIIRVSKYLVTTIYKPWMAMWKGNVALLGGLTNHVYYNHLLVLRWSSKQLVGSRVVATWDDHPNRGHFSPWKRPLKENKGLGSVMLVVVYRLGSHGMKITIKPPFGRMFLLLFPSILSKFKIKGMIYHPGPGVIGI